MDTPLVINIDTGLITFRTEENANHCNCRPISRKHAKMVERGELELTALLSAIKKHMMSAEDFDYDKYADERRKLNVRHSALHADERTAVEDAKPEDYVTDDEIENVNNETSDPVANAVAEAKVPRKERVKKVSDVLDSETKPDASGIEDVFSK